jgi:hypothetical protein
MTYPRGETFAREPGEAAPTAASPNLAFEVTMLLAALTLLHVLMFVYWLGGDLGAFYISRYMVDPKRSVPERALALKTLGDIDMAPRTCLILALPTGLTLAKMKSWWDVPDQAVIGVWILAVVWLLLAWTIHLKHSPAGGVVRRLDLILRWGVLFGLVILGLAGLKGATTAPLFINIKLLLLATAIGCGLLIRVQLAPLGAPVQAMLTTGPTADTDAQIAAVLSVTRPVVMVLWALIITAAFMGLWMPA